MEGDKKVKFSLQTRKYSYAIRNRIIYPKAVYHLIQRAPGDEIIFKEEADYLHMLSLLKKTAAKFRWDVFSFVLMPNHVHFLIRILEENLSQGAKYLFQSYALYFNEKYGRKGPVFCRPYRAFLCGKERYLLAISLYIHLNPYKAGLVSNPWDYPWSSLNLFVENRNYKAFVDYKFILSLLHCRDIKQARKAYRELLEEAAGLNYDNLLEKRRFLYEFCAQITRLRNSLTFRSFQKNSGEMWDLEREIEKFQELKYSRFTTEKKKRIIEKFLSEGYSIDEIKNFLDISRQHIYRLLSIPR